MDILTCSFFPPLPLGNSLELLKQKYLISSQKKFKLAAVVSFSYRSKSLVVEVKMLLKLAITSKDHLDEYKARITHCSNDDIKIF